jgi:hypothetical protein
MSKRLISSNSGNPSSKYCLRILPYTLPEDSSNSLRFPDFDSKTSFDYEKNLRTRSLSSLITEMEVLKQQVEDTKKEIIAAAVLDSQLHLINHGEDLRNRILAVQIEIGRRLQHKNLD